jgi:hypothetical protein
VAAEVFPELANDVHFAFRASDLTLFDSDGARIPTDGEARF